jgi:hypothetical protein
MLHSVPPESVSGQPFEVVVVEPPKVDTSDGELNEELANQLDCDPDPQRIAERISELVVLHDTLAEHFDQTDPDLIIEEIEDLKERAERAPLADAGSVHQMFGRSVRGDPREDARVARRGEPFP